MLIFVLGVAIEKEANYHLSPGRPQFKEEDHWCYEETHKVPHITSGHRDFFAHDK